MYHANNCSVIAIKKYREKWSILYFNRNNPRDIFAILDLKINSYSIFLKFFLL